MQLSRELSERRTAKPVYASAGWLDPVTQDILMQIMTELATMISILGRAPAGRRIAEIQLRVRAFLRQAAECIMAREIDPWVRLRLSPDEPPVSPLPASVRIGFFPLSANPIHWGHLLSALSVMARARLDKIIFTIASDSPPSTELYPEEMRRGAAAEAVSLFQPLFTLIPASAGRTLSGPASLFRLLGLNNQQMIEAFYIIVANELASSAGVIEVMEALWGHSGSTVGVRSEKLHPISLIRVDSTGVEKPSLHDNRVLVIPHPLPGISTAAVRGALRSSFHRDELAALPACAFRLFRMFTALD